MQMQMNNYGRGFGGPPQPQRAGGRRGFNRGGGGNFRQTRFDNNFQRNQNQNQGQRPNGNVADNSPTPNQNQQQPKPQMQNQQAVQAKPQQPQTAPQQQQAKPQQQQQQQPKPAQQQQQQPKPLQQQQQKTPQQAPQQQQKPQQPQQAPKPQVQQQQTPKPQPQQQKPQQNVPKPLNTVQDKVDAPHADPKPLMKMSFDLTGDAPSPQNNQPQQQQKNLNGNFGGNNQGGNNQGGYNQGGWQSGGGNKQGGGAGNRQFGGPKQGGHQGGMGQGQGPRNQGPRNQDRRGPMNDGKPVQREEHMLANKLKELVGPLLDLQPLDQSETRFNGRSRLYIGNLTNDVSEEEILKLFAPYGETAELFLNKEKNFGFIKLDYRVNAEKAKRELDGQMRNGRTLRVRFAPHNSAIRVKNLPPFVSNELLYRAFEIFGKIERAYVKVDERGKTLGEGVVEYMRKPSALAAIRNCTEKCFFLTSSLRPVIVESYEEPDEFDGYPEKNLPKKHPEFLRSRDLGPRFSELNSFEHEYGTRWKQLHELHRQKEEALKKELAAEQEKLEAQMEYAKYEHETELLRAQLRQREQDRERQKRNWEMAERSADERRDTERANLLRQEEELALRMRAQDDELRRRQQENTLFVQAQRLNSMLDRQEQGMFDSSQPMDGGFREQFDMGRGGYDDMPASRGWEGPRQIDDFPNKRRRF